MKDLITDSGIVLGIMNNDPKVWRYIYREMKNGFMAMLKKLPGCEFLDDDDLEDLFQKSSIYSINLCICAFGWPLSPEATIQQILCTVPTKDTIIMHSDFFANHEKIKSLMAKYQ